MSFHRYFQRLRLTDSLIRKTSTGTPKELSERLRLSKSATSELIKEMKEIGFPIEYSRVIRSYYYVKKVDPIPELCTLSEDSLRNIIGGGEVQFHTIMFNPIIIDWSSLNLGWF